jgi:hypothetical protein
VDEKDEEQNRQRGEERENDERETEVVTSMGRTHGRTRKAASRPRCSELMCGNQAQYANGAPGRCKQGGT